MTRHVLLALTSHGELGDTGRSTGFYVGEAAHPSAVLKGAGFDVGFVSVKGGRPPMDGVDRDDTVVARFLDDPDVRAKLENTARPGDLDARDYDAILFVGGHGAMWDFPDDEALKALAVGIYEHGGVVGAVCHGPAGLVNLRLSDGSYLVDGKEVAGFTNEEEEAVGLTGAVPFLLEDALTARGAKHTKAGKFQAHAIADGRLVTGQNPASAQLVGTLMVEALRRE